MAVKKHQKNAAKTQTVAKDGIVISKIYTDVEDDTHYVKPTEIKDGKVHYNWSDQVTREESGKTYTDELSAAKPNIGTSTVEMFKKVFSTKFKKGGKAGSAKQISDLKAAINSPATPEAQKVKMREILAKLEAEPAKADPKKVYEASELPEDTQAEVDAGRVTYRGTGFGGDYKLKIHGVEYLVTLETMRSFEDGKNKKIRFDAPHRKEGNPDKSERFDRNIASKPKAAKASPAAAPYDCDELIRKEKERKENSKAAAAARADAPTKTPATKNTETIIKAAVKVEENIEKRLEKNEVSKSEIEKLIKETKALLTRLESALKKAK